LIEIADDSGSLSVELLNQSHYFFRSVMRILVLYFNMENLIEWNFLKDLLQLCICVLAFWMSIERFAVAEVKRHLLLEDGQVIAVGVFYQFVFDARRLAKSIKRMVVAYDDLVVLGDLDVCLDHMGTKRVRV
jgi:hypothetical protein